MALTSGTKLGPYEIFELRGAGGMGEVYRARDGRLGRAVAIKVLPASFAADTERLRRFEQEARAAAALNHPNVLTVYDVGTLPTSAKGAGGTAPAAVGAPFIVSELLEGESLRDRLVAGALPQRKAIDYAVQVARGLAAAHDKGIVHRDLKPDNIFITSDGRVKILDFGLAKLTETAPSELTSGPTMQSGTEAGTVLGTLGYMAPEQVRGKAADARTDIFAFGAVLYEMLSGRRAFRGETSADVMSAILKEEPPELSATNRAVAPAIDHIVRRCLEKEAQQRFQSAGDLAFQLGELSGESSATHAQAPPMALGYWTQRRATFAVVCTLALALATTLAYFVGAGRVTTVPPTFHQLTYQQGTISSAAYAPDGATVIFVANWGGNGNEVYSARMDSPMGVRPLGIRADWILAVSKHGEVALLDRPQFVYGAGGTLSRVPLGGGAPRPVLNGVISADWSPDGSQLGVSLNQNNTRFRIEYPIGKVLLERAEWMGDVRVSPDGQYVAFTVHPVYGDNSGSVAIVDMQGHTRSLTRRWGGVEGLAWSPSGKEVWFTAVEMGGSDLSLHAASLSGRERVLSAVPGGMLLQAVRPDGHVLVTHYYRRHMLMISTPDHPAERDLSWLDWAIRPFFSPDGKQIAFTDQGSASGPNYSIFLRGVDGSPAVRLGDGMAESFSPDGQWVVSRTLTPPLQYVLLPTGAGEPKQLTHSQVTHISSVSWLPDSKHMVAMGRENEKPPQTYLIDLEGNERAITPPGLAGFLVTNDGKDVLVRYPDGSVKLYPIAGGEPRPIAGIQAGDNPVTFSPDNRFLYVAEPQPPSVLKIFRIDIATGQRTLFRELKPPDPTGVYIVSYFGMTPDAKAYGYAYGREVSALYDIEGLR